MDSSNLGTPTIFVYDRYPGGLGFAQRGYELLSDWLEMCRAGSSASAPARPAAPAAWACPTSARPSTTTPTSPGGYPVPDKQAAVMLLGLIKRAGEDEGDLVE